VAIFLQIKAIVATDPLAPLNQLGYDEYTDLTLPVGSTDGEGENW